MLRALIVAIGVLMAAMGLLWIGQGLGYIRWPASSFMIDQSPWITRGAILALCGVALVFWGRRFGR